MRSRLADLPSSRPPCEIPGTRTELRAWGRPEGLHPLRLLQLFWLDVVGRLQNQPFDTRARGEAVQDVWQISWRHAAVEIAVGLHGDGGADPTSVEAAGRAGAHLSFGQAALLEHAFELGVQLLGPARRTRAFGRPVGTTIHAHE